MLHEIFAALQEFHPLLAGTFPLGLQTAKSDFDILCEAPSLDRFEAVARAAFGLREGFFMERRSDLKPPAVVASFGVQGSRVELFAQGRPVYEQNGFRHLVVEGRLLRLGGERLGARVLALKRAGLATEPAFAQVLGLQGNPFEAMLQLESSSDEELGRLLVQVT
jgi:hypothetical protein